MKESLSKSVTEKNLNVKYIDNLKAGSCGFHYEVIVEGEEARHVCPYKECKSYDDALEYFMKHFYKERHQGKTLFILHNIMTHEQIEQLSKAC